MPKKQMLKLEYSYLSLPDKFYQLVKPSPFINPELVLINQELIEQLNISINNQEDILSLLLESHSSFAQAYAGHQFGGFTKLGDGRAIVMGEYITAENERIDIQIKGSGRTMYSRGGDGKATLKAMLREYLMSEAIHHLKIPSSRSLFVAKTGEAVKRERVNDGAVVARLMKSHIRIGTFEYARHFGSTEDLQSLTDYTINRVYPEIEREENPALGLLKKVMTVQIELVVNWMRIGFIHGVMNTDNVSISGETFDYGPCAFMNTYHPDTVYSSIDSNGRYAFGNQAKITKWNIARFAEALLPVLHPDPDKALQLAQACIDSFDTIWSEKYYQMMLLKLGIENPSPERYPLVDELLKLMQTSKLDYTNTFVAFSYDKVNEDNSLNGPEFKSWIIKWKNTIDSSNGVVQAKKIMIANNPAFIPRNHLVEEALDAAVDGNRIMLEKLLLVLKTPYQYQENMDYYTVPPNQSFENRYATYCGT
jgi:uncharacterized protein YdiU (UPF0061 family)